MKSVTIYHYSERKGHRLLVLLVIMCILLPGVTYGDTTGDSYRYSGHGQLTDIENEDSVIIDKKGYEVTPSILVVNEFGKPVSLSTLTIPLEVYFEYIYKESRPKTMSPFIIYIEPVQKNGNNRRNLQ